MSRVKISLKNLAIIFTLVLISPVFGVILAEAVGYHEPLDIAAEELHLEDLTEAINWTPFLDYSVPGLPDELGYVIAGFIGVGIILLVDLMFKKMFGAS